MNRSDPSLQGRVNAARNIHQARALAAEPPKRTLKRVGKRKQLREAA